jgi:hypothetical protein
MRERRTKLVKALTLCVLVAGIGLTGPATVVAQNPTVVTLLDFARGDSWQGAVGPNGRQTLVQVGATRNFFVTDIVFSNFGTVATCGRITDTSGPLSGRIIVPSEDTVSISFATGLQVGAGENLFVRNCAGTATQLEYTVSGFYVDLSQD